MLLGVSLPWRVSPYLELAFDPVDMFAEAWLSDDDHASAINGYIGVGARFSIVRHLSVDLGYKYRNVAANPHSHHHTHSTNFSTASVSLNLMF